MKQWLETQEMMAMLEMSKSGLYKHLAKVPKSLKRYKHTGKRGKPRIEYHISVYLSIQANIRLRDGLNNYLLRDSAHQRRVALQRWHGSGRKAASSRP